MATLVLTNAEVLLDGVASPPVYDFSDWVKSVTLNFSADMLEDTSMGDTTHSKQPGLKDWSVDLEMFQDFAEYAALGNKSPDYWTFKWCDDKSSVNISVAPTTGGPSATIPCYRGLGVIESINPIAGSVGEMAMVKVRIVPTKKLHADTSGVYTTALVRAVA